MNIQKFRIGKPFNTEAVILDFPIESAVPEYIRVDNEEGKIYISLPLDSQDIIYGLGEQMGGINKRGRKYRSFCSDDPYHTEEKEALYGAHNFFIISGKTTVGYFIDFPGQIHWDMGFMEEDKISITIDGTNADIYVISGNGENEIVKDFRTIIGTSYMPPMWAFGYQQSRWSYPDKNEINRIIEGYEKAGIPLDTVYLDIDYMDNFKDFTINQKAFPDFEKYVAELKEKGIRLIPIIDAGIKWEKGFDVYEEGAKNNYFCKDRKGNDFKAAVWPGICCFPDYLKADARRWFGDKFLTLTKKGIQGFWIDMNEPALFYSKEKYQEAVDYVKEYSGEDLNCWEFFSSRDKFTQLSNNNEDYKNMMHLDGTVCHYDVHNLYGYMMTKGVCESLPKDTLLFSRASYIGSHRYGGIWTGDNASWWSHILLNLRMLPSLNMCGYLYIGADCGGFNNNASRELLLRWMQLSVFTPLFRNHSALGTRSQEAFAFGNSEDFKKVIEVRYRLIPYLYSLVKKCAENNEMMFKPLGFEFKDKLSLECDDQLLIGDEIMIAPIYQQNKTGRTVYLPEEMTFVKLSGSDVTHKETLKKGIHYIDVAIDEVPFFVRKDKKVPLCNPAKNVDNLDITIAEYI
ncbi:MAG: alpha-glucosidase [Oscillospiraceae bacterium]|nr:alpha-glucosidase [Oscillospiraceae bacterium]